MILYMSKFSEMIAEMSDEIHKYIRKCIDSASFDKNKSARITQVLDNNEYVVTMSDGAVRTVPSLSSDSFNVNDVVRVTVAQNDSKNSYIIGKPNIPKGSSGGGVVDSVNGQTGAVVLDADDISDASTGNKFVTASDKTKLGNLSGVNTGDQDLYSVGGSNRNLLENWDFRDPVNQRGVTSWSSGYGLDRWLFAGGGSILVNSGSVSLNNAVLTQFFEVGWLKAATYTVSVFADNIYGNATVGFYGGANYSSGGWISDGNGLFHVTITVTSNDSTYRGFIYIGSTATNITKVKLELGSVSTLANDPPADYGEELRKCQRYYYDSSYNNSDLGGSFVSKEFFNSDHMFCNVRFPVQMRIVPSVIIKSAKGTLNAVSYWASAQDAITSCIANSATIGCSGFNGVSSSGLFDTNSVYAFHVIAIADL